MTFAQAIKTPKAGWKYANDEPMLAALADALARNCCLNAQQVFEWAKRHSNYRDLRRATARTGFRKPSRKAAPDAEQCHRPGIGVTGCGRYFSGACWTAAMQSSPDKYTG